MNLGWLHRKFSRRELVQILSFVAFPIHFWSILYFLRGVPSWILYMSASEFIGLVAYTLFFSLIETLAVFTILIIPGLLIPNRWLKGNYPTLCSLFVVEMVILGFVLISLLGYGSVSLTPLVGFFLLVILSIIFVYRYPIIKRVMEAIALRLTPLIALYLLFDGLSTVIVIFRNI